MQYCKVILNEVPVPLFAHIYESTRYDYLLPQMENTLELSFIEQGDVLVSQEGIYTQTHRENTLIAIYNKKDIQCRSDAPLHRHITVGLTLDFEMHPISEAQIIDLERNGALAADGKICAILPLEQGLQLSPNSKIPDLIREIIRLYPNGSTGNRLLLVSKIMKLLSEVTQECVRRSFLLKQISPANILCVQRAMQYISGRIQQRIMVEEVAKAVELSPGYLSNVFKQVTGQTLIEYVNRTKLQIVKELVLNGQMTFSQAGEYVGIPDSGYLSRIFRKYLGTTIRELKNQPEVISE